MKDLKILRSKSWIWHTSIIAELQNFAVLNNILEEGLDLHVIRKCTTWRSCCCLRQSTQLHIYDNSVLWQKRTYLVKSSHLTHSQRLPQSFLCHSDLRGYVGVETVPTVHQFLPFSLRFLPPNQIPAHIQYPILSISSDWHIAQISR